MDHGIYFAWALEIMRGWRSTIQGIRVDLVLNRVNSVLLFAVLPRGHLNCIQAHRCMHFFLAGADIGTLRTDRATQTSINLLAEG